MGESIWDLEGAVERGRERREGATVETRRKNCQSLEMGPRREEMEVEMGLRLE